MPLDPRRKKLQHQGWRKRPRSKEVEEAAAKKKAEAPKPAPPAPKPAPPASKPAPPASKPAPPKPEDKK